MFQNRNLSRKIIHRYIYWKSKYSIKQFTIENLSSLYIYTLYFVQRIRQFFKIKKIRWLVGRKEFFIEENFSSKRNTSHELSSTTKNNYREIQTRVYPQVRLRIYFVRWFERDSLSFRAKEPLVSQLLHSEQAPKGHIIICQNRATPPSTFLLY